MTVEFSEHKIRELLVQHSAPAHLSDYLRPQQIVVAGSFVLRALYTEVKWEPHDIDIWISAQADHTPLLRYLQEDGYAYNLMPVYTRESLYHRYDRQIASLYHLTCPGRLNIQILILQPTADLLQTIREFDLNVCRYFYDGNQVYGWEPLGTEVSFTVDSLLIQSSRDQLRSLKRLLKYQDRGFQPVFSEVTKTLLIRKIEALRNTSLQHFHTREWNSVAYTRGFPIFVNTNSHRWSLLNVA
jgi:hypothetical protein